MFDMASQNVTSVVMCDMTSICQNVTSVVMCDMTSICQNVTSVVMCDNTICDALPQKIHKVAGSERRYTPKQVV